MITRKAHSLRPRLEFWNYVQVDPLLYVVQNEALLQLEPVALV